MSNLMGMCYWIICFLALSCLVRVYEASTGDSDHLYRTCVEQCDNNGCVGERCFSNCGNSSLKGPSDTREPRYFWWDCLSECRYRCMHQRENERAQLGQQPVRYHGKWPFRRLYGMQEPGSVLFSVINLVMHLHGWLSFSVLLYYKLPSKAGRPPYNFADLWHLYALFSINAWFWSAIFHSRDVDLTEKLDYSSAFALLGYSLLLSLIRSFGIRSGSSKVMVAAPVIGFTITHIMFLNNFEMDYGWNIKVCIVVAVAQLLTWFIWAAVTQHPSRRKVWTVVLGGSSAMLLEIYDFPPFLGFMDAHALWHAATFPLAYVWWSFIKDDAKYKTSNVSKKVR